MPGSLRRLRRDALSQAAHADVRRPSHGRQRHRLLAATGGVHDHEDVLKLLMVGADVTMMTSALLLKGIYHIGKVRQDMIRWMEEHGYSSVGQLKGSMSQRSYSDPSAFERANYIKVLESYKVVHAYRAG
jgi:hypothetical protein